MAGRANEVFYATHYHPIQAGSIDGTDTTPHDNGICRAMVAKDTGIYDPTRDCKAAGDPYCTLFVGRLSPATTEETLAQVMSKYGKIKNLRLVRHIVTGASRRYAFVEYESTRDYLHAYEAAHNINVDGHQIIVDYNRQKLMPGWIPRRLGGGLGGKKESGQLRFGGRDRPFRAPLRENIPLDELRKLGIPEPSNYMSRYQIPPLPRKKSDNNDEDRDEDRDRKRRRRSEEVDNDGGREDRHRRRDDSSRRGNDDHRRRNDNHRHEKHYHSRTSTRPHY